MFARLKQIVNPKNRDLQKKLLFVFAALFIFKLGTAIIVPGVNKGIGNLGFLELINVMGGGAMEKFSIFALGVMPYITASIVIQLLQMDIVPYLTELSKQGATGRNKINAITRIVGIALAFIQGYVLSFSFIKGGTVFEYMQFSVVLTAGTAFLLWLGDQITAKGIGNGISLIIMAGIISTLPSMFASAFNGLVVKDGVVSIMGTFGFIAFVLIYVAIVIGVIFEETAERRIPIQYANRSNAAMGGNQNYIPFKINSAGVVPVIFASALVSIPGVIASMTKNVGMQNFVGDYLSMTSVTGFLLYVALIIVFAYFYTFLQIKPKELSENLQQNGGFIPGVRPGEETIKHLNKVLTRITIVGAIFLAVLAAIPVFFGALTGLSSVTLGGTGLLIVVGVALETYKQIESELTTKEYSKGRRRRR